MTVQFPRPFRMFARQLRSEWRTLFRPSLAAILRTPQQFPVAITATVCVLLLTTASRFNVGEHFITHWCTVSAAMPILHASVRLIPSIFAPTSMLPDWLDAFQIGLIIGLAEFFLGKTRTILVAFSAHALATLSARWFIALGPTFPLGLPLRELYQGDTGPSAVTTALFAHIAARTGSWICVTILVTGMSISAWKLPGLASSEHMTAMFFGVISGAVSRLHTVKVPNEDDTYDLASI